MTDADENGFVPIFDGSTLNGWFATPRTYGQMWPGGPTVQDAHPDAFPADYNEQAALHPAVWTVEDGAIVGRQDSPGSGWGGYLVSEKTYGDFELIFEAKPDWPADTGIMLRKKPHTFHGLQVLLDHRQSGSIGGFYGNGIGGFHAVPFALDVVLDDVGKPIGLCQDDPKTSIEPFTRAKRDLLTESCSVEDFLSTWKFGDWNAFRVRIVGGKPRASVWINGLLIASIDLATIKFPNYDADAVADFLGPKGHIAFEVHDNDKRLGEGRWGRTAACRWRNIRIKEL
ncbi:DUF1080 domain-containing protein (plasmid) [Agrobacterium leguminum]|uniref:3-keto-alpha-glucoside-1,2-lyase/3-keto-2-hydroxy-glucal hydratase domain-containing protein n=1 Tax=Agrobacterium deltaense NCPPB 1641 TaxID=1183425 RepID=A0A1S7UBY0_9HYPH|nr:MULTISPECIES: DUF1080 domain-containing protein [Agrobacterium]WFS69776.1 DUF1080 domain-containing protein [Agrobacterium leguminum]CVI64091.1 conserved hypothetical protein [Agrobacterium deltaense NCPPB 1641]